MIQLFGAKKGSFGFIRSRRKVTLIRSFFLFAIAFGFYFFGLRSYGTNKNLFTILSVLAFLPASGSTVNFVMFMRAKGCSEELHKLIEGSDMHKTLSYYDLFFTTEKKNYSVYHLCVRDNTVICLPEAGCDHAALESHLKGMLEADGYKGVTVKAFAETGKYTERLASVSEREAENEKLSQGIVNTLFSVSLG